jgi:hypothetical protein
MHSAVTCYFFMPQDCDKCPCVAVWSYVRPVPLCCSLGYTILYWKLMYCNAVLRQDAIQVINFSVSPLRLQMPSWRYIFIGIYPNICNLLFCSKCFPIPKQYQAKPVNPSFGRNVPFTRLSVRMLKGFSSNYVLDKFTKKKNYRTVYIIYI